MKGSLQRNEVLFTNPALEQTIPEIQTLTDVI